MSESGHTDDIGDTAVSSTYSKLSDETTPASLDRKIMRLAASEGSKRPLSNYLSLKPLAWAATMILTVSLVVHLQQDAATTSEAVLEQQYPDQDAAIFDADEATHYETDRRQDALEEVVVAKPAPGPAASDAGSQPLAPATSRAIVQQARELAAERELDETEALGFSAAQTLEKRATQAEQPARYCSPAEMADASSWYQCILALEADGKLEEAAAERTRLFSAYPDFRVR